MTLYIGIMIICGFVEGHRLNENSRYYYPPALHPSTGQPTTKVQAWLGRMLGDGLALGAVFLIVGYFVG